MSSPLIISVSGLRGEIGATLTPDVAVRYALAYSKSVDSKEPFVVAYDGRRSGSLFADAVCSALNAVGRTTLDAGVAATPTVGILVRQYGAAGGIQISASHNPRQFNGLKLFSHEGRVIPKKDGERVLELYRQSAADANWRVDWVDVDRLGRRIKIDDSTIAHMESVLKTVDADLIRSKKYRVLLDSNNASGSLLGKRLLENLGCEVVVCGGIPNGDFLHTPEPTVENLQGVLQKIVDAGACVGFCQDPDADRLALVDEKGRYIGEEYTTAICAKNRLQKARDLGEQGPYNLVINCASSRMSLDIAAEYGGSCFRSPVGEANVVDLMKAKNAIFGGEGNGGPIDPAVGFVRDSFVGMAHTLEFMARNSKPLSEVADDIQGYAIVKRKVGLPEGGFQRIVDVLSEAFVDEDKNTEDGIRIDWSDAWVLARPSNTEPIARVIAEAPTEERANELCDRVEQLMGLK
ncbi:MAG: phosphoglucosamine mutase [Thermoguttaceae bacterium]|nr:phosphoglucosamine mutase [Thermoguttaceae bacterium]